MGKIIEDPSLRPVGARALKSAMDTLRPFLAGAQVLDLFAGQGRFSFSALQEGASAALLIEKNPRTARELEGLRPKKIPQERKSTILRKDVWDFLDKPKGDLYDIVFADPPFQDWSAELEQRLFSLLAKFSKPGTILLVKYPKQMLLSSSHSGFKLWKINHFGESQLAYFTYGESQL